MGEAKALDLIFRLAPDTVFFFCSKMAKAMSYVTCPHGEANRLSFNTEMMDGPPGSRRCATSGQASKPGHDDLGKTIEFQPNAVEHTRPTKSPRTA
jgi:hypothetical protein